MRPRTSLRLRAAVAVADTSSALLRLLMRLVIGSALLISTLVGLAIGLRVLGANPHNEIVSAIHSAANFFAGAFTGLFAVHQPRLAIVVNWGIAVGVFLLAGSTTAALIAKLSRSVARPTGEVTQPQPLDPEQPAVPFEPVIPDPADPSGPVVPDEAVTPIDPTPEPQLPEPHAPDFEPQPPSTGSHPA